MNDFKYIGMDGCVDQNLNSAILDGKEILKDGEPLKFKELMVNGCIISVPDELAPQLEASGLYERKYKSRGRPPLQNNISNDNNSEEA